MGLARVLAVALNAAFFFVAPYTRDVGLARSGSFFVAYSATSVVIRLFGRRVLDVLGPHLISYPAFAIFGFGLAALALLPAPGILVLSGIACGAGHGTLFPVLNALAISRATRLQGTVVSLHRRARLGPSSARRCAVSRAARRMASDVLTMGVRAWAA
jgi:MFS family permease